MKDERFQELMEDVGMPNSRSLLKAFQQIANEAVQEYILNKNIPPPEKVEEPECDHEDFIIDTITRPGYGYCKDCKKSISVGVLFRGLKDRMEDATKKALLFVARMESGERVTDMLKESIEAEGKEVDLESLSGFKEYCNKKVPVDLVGFDFHSDGSVTFCEGKEINNDMCVYKKRLIKVAEIIGYNADIVDNDHCNQLEESLEMVVANSQRFYREWTKAAQRLSKVTTKWKSVSKLTADFLKMTQTLSEHPKDWDGPCKCMECMSNG